MRHVTLVFLLLTALVLASITASASRHASPGDTIVVASTSDHGPGTLRQALLDAQYGDTITFDPAVFPPTAPVTISLAGALPQIHQGNLTLDASNAGVILDGTNVPGAWVACLQVNSNGNTVQGLQVSNFSGTGIAIGGACNTIGGDRSVGAGPHGQGNLTSRNDVGVGLWGSHVSSNTIEGNLIGSDATGVVELGNRHGVEISEGANGNVVGPDNVIAHNDVGVLFHQGSNGNAIGPDNVIAHNDGAGIDVVNPETLHNTITQNSIHDNDGMGIDLWDGGNGELAAPHITDLDLDAGTVTGTACSSCTIEVFSDGCSEGKVYEGRTTADGA
ncbi:MAG: right-handed parallel beta-helix repeat-containing protein, partial [Anaerolineae bacterium]